MSKKKGVYISLFIVVSFILLAVFYNFYFTALNNFREGRTNDVVDVRDIINHSRTAFSLVESIKMGKEGIGEFLNTSKFAWIAAYPLWHISVYIIYVFLSRLFPHMSVEILTDISSSFVNSVCVVMTWLIITQFLLIKIERLKNRHIIRILIGISLILVGPLDVSAILGHYYLGAYTGNIWHNPTYLIVRPCALLVFFLYIRLLSNKNPTTLNYIITSILLALSAFLKPNFFQSFLPGLVLYCIIYFLRKRNLETFIKCLKIALTCIPVTIIALLQYSLALGGGEGGIGISLLYVWKHFSEEWELSLFASIAFPMYVYLLAVVRKRWNLSMTLSMYFLVSSLLQYMLFFIKNGAFAGDFSWGVGLSIFVCFIIAVYELLQCDYTRKQNLFFNISAWIIFFLHLLYGSMYLYVIWTRGAVRGLLGMWF